MRTTKTVLLSPLLCLLALGIAVGQQKRPQARQRTVDELAQAVRSRDAQALEQLRAFGNKGSVDAQFNLGVIYQNGEGVPKDAKSAVQWYGKAAEQGDADAQYALGWMYDAGEGVPENDALAAKWYRKAAEQGHPDAQFTLGSMYRDGKGVPQDSSLAAKWYRKAAEQGDTIAQNALERLGVLDIAFPGPNATDVVAPKVEERVVLKKQNGVLMVPVTINNRITLDFIVDSGATEVSIPADVVLTLMRTGTLTARDFTGAKTYVLADGSSVPSQTFRIRSLKVGDHSLENVSGSVTSVEGSLLLGQSFLGRFKSWAIDNVRQVLVLQ